MTRSNVTRAAIGALLVGIGVSMLLSASKKAPCVDCGDKAAEKFNDEQSETPSEVEVPGDGA